VGIKAEEKKNNNEDLENRVLVFMPTGRDAILVCATLAKADVSAQPCPDAQTLEKEIAAGAGAVLLAEEGVQDGTLEHLIETFNRQPVWSDLPVVLFAGSSNNSEKLLTTIGTRLNATIVERPIRVAMLISAVRGALRARQKQYQTRDLLNRLEDSDRQKDLFLATLSHELRTPLNSILGWIQLLRGKPDTIDANHGLEVIERNAKAQSEIISDILFVSRIITGKLTLNLKPIDLVPVIQQAVEVVLPSVEAKNIQMNVFFDPDVRQIKGDHDRLKQVFWNILSNAVKFTPPHGRIDVSAFVRGAHVEIEIRDTGMGIEPDFLPLIFERFSQADSSYTRKVGGLGLGLAIVRHLIEIHGGSVSVASEGANRGATFTIKLPVLTARQTASAAAANGNAQKNAEAEKASAPPEGIHVLLVEDNDDSREMLAVLFAQSNLQITAVASAAEALAELERIKPDVLISDIGMPDQDGYALIRQVRARPPEKSGSIPAIALTGYASLQDRDLALQAGYQEHLSKPVDTDELLELVKKLLDKPDHSKIMINSQ
jgi:signal transduction histidine kinase/CheY-like chemotaxis protein